MKYTKFAGKMDIDRNIKLLREGKALDLPLAYLDGNFKKKFNHLYPSDPDYYKKYYEKNKVKIRAYQRTRYNPEYMKKYYAKNKVKILAYQKAWRNKRKMEVN